MWMMNDYKAMLDDYQATMAVTIKMTKYLRNIKSLAYLWYAKSIEKAVH